MGRMQLFMSLAVLSGALALGFSTMPGPVGADEAGAIEWLTDLDKARAKAKEEERPLLVVFR